MKRYADVVVPTPLKNSYQYRIPKGLESEVSVGKRVIVPFGKRVSLGYVVELGNKKKFDKLKAISKVIDEGAVFDESMLKLTKWISDYYFCSWGEALKTAYPFGNKIAKRKGKIRVKTSKDESYKRTKPHKLNENQSKALNLIKECFDEKIFSTILLFGITASGKTEVYMQAIEEVLKSSKGVIVLVPEISLTPQIVEQFKGRFGDKIGVLHSKLSVGEKMEEWEKIASGQAQIVIGVRSAIFAPVRNLGLIIVDEEHENSYKQNETPRYHARDIAIMRAKFSNATCVLGSATPSVESYYNVKNRRFHLALLPTRIEQRGLPNIRVIDMRGELLDRGNKGVFSLYLQDRIRETLGKGKQVILFMNRRGFATFILCRGCGNVVKCSHCSVSLTYHMVDKIALCHYCGYRTDLPTSCPKCGKEYISYFGTGTQKVEKEINRLFPEAVVVRMDADSTARKGTHDRIFKDFRAGKYNVLVGTQMVTKGFDFPNVDLVGVVCADSSLNLPDFRSGERTFQLLTQVSGRAGRRKDKGEVVIQTYTPNNYIVYSASRYEYINFYTHELRFRQSAGYPPYSRFVLVTFHDEDEARVIAASREFVDILFSEGLKDKEDFLGPAPAPVSKVRGKFRYHLILKGRKSSDLHDLLSKVMGKVSKKRGMIRSLKITVDVDPVSLL